MRRRNRVQATLIALLAALLLAAGACGGDDDADPDVSAYCPAEEELINAQIALKTATDEEALAEQIDEVEQLTREFEREAPELIQEQATVVADETFAVLDEIREEELTPADASDRLTGQFASEEVATANAIIAAFDAEFCPEFEGTIPNIPDPAVPIPPAAGEPSATTAPGGDSTTTTAG